MRPIITLDIRITLYHDSVIVSTFGHSTIYIYTLRTLAALASQIHRITGVGLTGVNQAVKKTTPCTTLLSNEIDGSDFVNSALNSITPRTTRTYKLYSRVM